MIAIRAAVRRCLAAASLLALGAVGSAAAADSRPPNILFLFADDWGRYASILAETDPPGGPNEIARTPNFDRIARAGVLFRNAHVSAPSCTPCRSALLTGQHFWRTGSASILQGAVWNEALPSFPPLLEQAGYHIGYAHKVWGPGTPGNAPFEGRHAFGRHGGRINQFSQNATKLVAEGRSVEEAKAELLDEVRANFRSFLEARRPGQPFCFWFGPTNVHRPWTKGSGKALWGIDPDSLAGRLPAPLPDVPEVREDFADYLGEIAAWDAAIGVILAELDAAGARDDTLVAISGDHGPPGFPHGKCNLYGFGTGVCLSITGPGVTGGRVVDDMTNLTDLAPTFLEAAGVSVPGVMSGRSLWPVLRSEATGRVDPARTQVFTGRERHVAAARADFSPYPQRAIRTPTHALIVNFHPERWPLGDPYRLDGGADPTADELERDTFVTLPDVDASPTKAWLVGVRKDPRWAAHFDWVFGRRPRVELYDLARDPDETTNVAADPAYAAVASDLERRLMDELVRTGDPRVVDGGATAATPNIVVIYADDLGYGDVHCYNPDRGKIPTPHLDRLAAQGMRFTDAHSSSGVCSPSRYALLTGRYHWRTRLQSGIVGTWGDPLIAADRVTLGTLARQHGYRTACIGKWHLGWDWSLTPAESRLVRAVVQPKGVAADAAGPTATAEQQAAWQRIFSRPIAGGPTSRGFDVYFGTDAPNWPPFCFIADDRTVGIPSEFLPAADLQDHRASVQGPALPDWKLEAVLPSLRDRAVDFIADRGRAKQPFLLYMPLTSPHTPLAVNEPWRGKSGLDNACADLIMETDAVVGDVLAALDAAGVADDTLVVFTSDNGFAPYVGVKKLEARGHYPSGPLRGYKSDAWEGGHRVAFIARWPGIVKPGSVCDQLVHQADLMATCAEILGTTLPHDAGEDSFSLVPLLKGSTTPVREHAVSCSMRGVPGVRLGSWKYIADSGSGGWTGGDDPTQNVQLYDLASDLGERKNLAGEQPGRVAEMQALLERLITTGRSRPGPPQQNDVEVVRYPRPPAAEPARPAPSRPGKTTGR